MIGRRIHLSRGAGHTFVSTYHGEDDSKGRCIEVQPGPSGWQLMPGVTNCGNWTHADCPVTADWPVPPPYSSRTKLPARIVKALDAAPGGWNPAPPRGPCGEKVTR